MAGGFEGEMVTDATATVGTGARCTVMVPIPDFPATLAETCVVPGATPVTTPSSEILATLASWTDQKTSASVSVLPAVSCTTALSDRRPPIETEDADGDTATVATSRGVDTSFSELLHAAIASTAPQTRERTGPASPGRDSLN